MASNFMLKPYKALLQGSVKAYQSSNMLNIDFDSRKFFCFAGILFNKNFLPNPVVTGR